MSDASLTKLVVRRKLGGVMRAVFRDSDISPTITKAFEQWADQYTTKQERQLIEAYALSYLLDAERRLRNIRQKIKSDIFMED